MVKKLTAIFLALAVAFTFTPAMVGTASAAAKKPAKVAGLKAKPAKTSLTLTWKKAKNAKKYEVYQLKAKKYKKIKTLKTRKLVVKKLKTNTKYKFKVRGINGKKKGKFSKVIAVKTKKGTLHKKPITDSSKTNFVVGDTYIIKNSDGATTKVTITEKTDDGYVKETKGITSEGGTYEKRSSEGTESVYVLNNPFMYLTTDWDFDNDEVSDVFQFILKTNDVQVYWTIDGTEPKIGQTDKVGTSKYAIFPKGETVDEKRENRRAGKFDPNYKAKLRGTITKKGTTGVLVGDRVTRSNCKGTAILWYKAYRCIC